MIKPVTNNYDINFMYSNRPDPKQDNANNSNTTPKASKKIARTVGITGAVLAVGGGTAYYLLRGKKAQAEDILDKAEDIVQPEIKKAEDVLQDIVTDVAEQVKSTAKNIIEYIKPKDKETGAFHIRVMNGDTFVKSVESEGYEKSEDLLVKDGFVRQIYTKWADGSTATTEDLLTPDKKVYERMTVKGDDIFRYNYAYNQEGKPVGYAKEHTHQGFKRNVEPMTVKMYDGKEVNANDVWSLFEAEPAFDPRVTQK